MILEMLGFGGSPKRKSSRLSRVKKLASKVAKMKKAKALKDAEVKLKAEYQKMKGY
jgi:hypothetical protein